MSTDMIDTQYGQRCCVAVFHCGAEALAAYHAHLVAQVGDSAPSSAEILEHGKAVSEAVQMGLSQPRCFYCGDEVPKGTCCPCVVEELPFRASRATVESAIARGEGKSFVACVFACATCGARGEMSAEQLLRAGGTPYKACTRCARKSAIAKKAASAATAPVGAKASPEMKAAHAFAAKAKAIMGQAVADVAAAKAAQTAAQMEAARKAVTDAARELRAAEKASTETKAELVAAAAQVRKHLELAESLSATARAGGLPAETVAQIVSPVREDVAKAQAALARANTARDGAVARVKGATTKLEHAKANLGLAAKGGM